MSELLNKQQQFSKMLSQFLIWLFANDYEVTFGEVKRTKEQAEENASKNIGILKSLHLISLAVDLNLFKNGQFLTDPNDYQLAGEYWESIGGSWGGRFKNVDADHFSLAYNGVR